MGDVCVMPVKTMWMNGLDLSKSVVKVTPKITKTCPCSMKQFLKVEKMIFIDVKMRHFSYFLLKTLIVGTC